MRSLIPTTKTWLMLAIGLFVILAFSGQYAKFTAFGYDGLDLGIYTQVTHETSLGRMFAFTIHPHSYLGDHVELFLLVLVPFYKIIASPLTLLGIQTLALGLGAIPLYAIARKRLNASWALGAGIAYLLSPFIWSMNFFEFHLLPFAIPILLAALSAYENKRLFWYYAWLLLALGVREDVALVVGGIALVALIQRRRWTWWLPVGIGAAVWFVIALKIAASFGTIGQYKFLRYYAWLGPDLRSMVANFFGHPLQVARVFFSFRLAAFVVGLGLPFAFLPLGALLWLLPTFPILLQLGLGGVGGEVTLQTHYVSLFLPFLFMGSIIAIQRLFTQPHRSRALGFFAASPGAAGFLLSAIVAYCFIVMGPIRGYASFVHPSLAQQEETRIQTSFLSFIPKNDPVATSFSFIGRLAQRSIVASLHYLYLGTEQYSDRPYHLPEEIQTLLIDESDFLVYHVTYPEDQEKYRGGDDRFRAILADRKLHLRLAVDDLALYSSKGPTDSLVPSERLPALPNQLVQKTIGTDTGLQLHGWDSRTGSSQLSTVGLTLADNETYRVLPVRLWWSQDQPTSRHASFTLRLTSPNGRRYEKEFALAPLFPQSEWPLKAFIATEHRFLIPAVFDQKDTQVDIALIDSKGVLSLNPTRSITPHYQTRRVLGSATLGLLSGRPETDTASSSQP